MANAADSPISSFFCQCFCYVVMKQWHISLSYLSCTSYFDLVLHYILWHYILVSRIRSSDCIYIYIPVSLGSIEVVEKARRRHELLGLAEHDVVGITVVSSVVLSVQSLVVLTTEQQTSSESQKFGRASITAGCKCTMETNVALLDTYVLNVVSRRLGVAQCIIGSRFRSRA